MTLKDLEIGKSAVPARTQWPVQQGIVGGSQREQQGNCVEFSNACFSEYS